MDITKIEVVLRAIEIGSLSKAAEEFSYTPSAMSHIVNSIENEIGARIIRRTYKGIEIEGDKEEVIEKLRQLVEIKNQIMEMAAESNSKKTITIGTYASLSKYVLPKIIKGFKRKFSDTDFNIIVDDEIENVYKSGNADILFGEKIERENIIWEELMIDPYVAVLPESYNLHVKSIRREELYKNTFIMAKDSKILNYMSGGIIDNIIKINSHDDSSVIQLVKEGMGVSVLSALSVGNNKGIVCAGLIPELTRVLGIMYDENEFHEKEYIRRFIEYFRLLEL